MDKCADLNTLQIWAGYLSWLGFFKTLAVCVLVGGIAFLTWGVLTKLVYRLRVLLEACGYLASVGLIASGGRVPDEYLVWTVFAGCLLLLATVCATIVIHDVEGKDPRTLSAAFAVIWGAVAVWYGMTEVGFLAVLALMNLLGFQFGVGPFSYWIGFEKKEVVPSATTAAFAVLAAFVAVRLTVPNPPAYLKVFMPGAFWCASFVMFTGLLIMSNRFYAGRAWPALQVPMVLAALAGLAVGMTFGIAPLAGIAGTFAVLYLAAKPIDVPADGAIGVGMIMIASGGIMFAAWSVATAHQDVVMRYLTAAAV